MQKGINSIPAMFQEQNTKRVTTAPSRLAANLSQIHSLQGDMVTILLNLLELKAIIIVFFFADR